ncbi:hypothetical protein CsSME_00027778 [Camellia sinensis var. sinensis]
MPFSMMISKRSIWISPLAILFPTKSILFVNCGRPCMVLSSPLVPVAHSSQGLFLSQRKYVLDGDTGDLFPDIGRYRRLVEKLIYLIVTRPDITYAVGVVSQFMHAPRQSHFVAVCRILQYLKRTLGWGNKIDRRSTLGYYTFVGGNLVTLLSKKQTVVARSSAEAEYHAMAHIASEMLWAAIFIANNPVFHKCTKHIEVDCHFICDLLLRKQLVTSYVHSEDQLGAILTKPLARPSFHRLSVKLGMSRAVKLTWSLKCSKTT